MPAQPPATLVIVDYLPMYKPYFRDLNLEWITKYFTVEEPDRLVLNNPEEYILDNGGCIFFALYNQQVVGTCALIKENDEIFELAKMAVSPVFHGKKIGKSLCMHAIEKARQAGAKKLVLISNSRLESALHMYINAGFYEVEFPHEKRIYERGDLKMELDLATFSVRQAARRLKNIITYSYPLLQQIRADEAAFKPESGKWSKKEILGHLIDSASNNQHKFVRTQETDGAQFPGYTQDFWVNAQHYHQSSWPLLIELWKSYNLHLAFVMQQFTADVINHQISISGGQPLTLEYIAVDYVAHLIHHLGQILPNWKE